MIKTLVLIHIDGFKTFAGLSSVTENIGELAAKYVPFNAQSLPMDDNSRYEWSHDIANRSNLVFGILHCRITAIEAKRLGADHTTRGGHIPQMSICLRSRLSRTLNSLKNLSVFLSAPAMISILMISSMKSTPPYFQLP